MTVQIANSHLICFRGHLLPNRLASHCGRHSGDMALPGLFDEGLSHRGQPERSIRSGHGGGSSSSLSPTREFGRAVLTSGRRTTGTQLRDVSGPSAWFLFVHFLAPPGEL